MNLNQKTLPYIVLAIGLAYFVWTKHQAATVLDRRYPMAYKS